MEQLLKSETWARSTSLSSLTYYIYKMDDKCDFIGLKKRKSPVCTIFYFCYWSLTLRVICEFMELPKQEAYSLNCAGFVSEFIFLFNYQFSFYLLIFFVCS